MTAPHSPAVSQSIMQVLRLVLQPALQTVGHTFGSVLVVTQKPRSHVRPVSQSSVVEHS